MFNFSSIIILSFAFSLNSAYSYTVKENLKLILFESTMQGDDQKVRALEKHNLELYMLRALIKKIAHSETIYSITEKININNEKIKTIKSVLKNKANKFIDENYWLSQEDIQDLRHRYYDTTWLTSKM